MPAYTQGDGSSLPEWITHFLENAIPEGERNKTLFRIASWFRDNRPGMSKIEVESLLLPLGIKSGLDQEETLRAIRSGLRSQKRAAPSRPQPPNGESPPGELPKPIPEGFRVLLETLFRSGEYVAISEAYLKPGEEKAIPGPGETRLRDTWIKFLPSFENGHGAFFRINPITDGGKTDADVTAYRHCLAEFDDKNISKESQYANIIESKLPVAALIDSGNKSIHAIIRVDAGSAAEFATRVLEVFEIMARYPGFDSGNKNPSRYSRLPNVMRNGAMQALLAVGVGPPSWEAYCKANTLDLEEMARRRQYYTRPDEDFPLPMAQGAFHGVAGEIVERILPLSEASAEALLGQFLVGVGNIIGRGPVCEQSGKHHLNEFLVLVGDSALARKGTSWNAIQAVLSAIDWDWSINCVKDSFQTGEGVVHAIRDASTHKGPGGRTVLDPGVGDKRLLIAEEEFGRFLVVSERKGNTITSTLRKAWDSPPRLRTESKTSSECASDPHVSVIGHVTGPEVRKCMGLIDSVNGFANRYLWIAARASKEIPIPVPVNWRGECKAILEQVARAIILCRKESFEFKWTECGKKAWKAFYTECRKTKRASVLGLIVNRAEAHVLRLAMIYAALDGTTLIDKYHMAAAVAVWDYSCRSAKWIFGERTGNKSADRILWELKRRPEGLTRTEISSEVLRRNLSASEISKALCILAEAGLAQANFETSAGTNKPTERWIHTP
jgi:hypothetical protein